MSDAVTNVDLSSRRMRLPQRRAHALLDIEHAGHRYTAGLGYFDTGLLAEDFHQCAGEKR